MMELNEYQSKAILTRVKPHDDPKSIVISLLGLSGEAGSLLSEFKKNFREGPKYGLFRERLCEELGDILWYLADIADQQGLSLEEIGAENLQKVRDMWHIDLPLGQLELPGISQLYFDEDYPENERLPREGRFEFRERSENCLNPRVSVVMDGKMTFGESLTDNSPDKDGYRFHDVFHLAYSAILHWSPATRKSLNRKRKSKPEVDENQDGGRALVVEEAISALVFEYARGHSFFEDVETVERELLVTIKRLARPFEVAVCAAAEWERAILEGYKVWRPMYEKRGGLIEYNGYKKELIYRALP